MAKPGLFPVDVAKRIFAATCGGAESEFREHTRPSKKGGGGGDGILFTTRTGGIPARTTTGVPHTFPYATCDLIDPASGNYYSPNREADIRNMTNITIDHVAGRVHQAKLIDGLYFIDVSGDC